MLVLTSMCWLTLSRAKIFILLKTRAVKRESGYVPHPLFLICYFSIVKVTTRVALVMNMCSVLEKFDPHALVEGGEGGYRGWEGGD